MSTIWVVEYGTQRRFYTVKEHAEKKFKSYKYAKYLSVKMFELELAHVDCIAKNNPDPPPPKQPGPVHIQANTFNIFDIVGDPNENNFNGGSW